MKQYSIILKNDKVRLYHRLSILVIIANLAIFLFFGIMSNDRKILTASIVSVSLVTACLLLNVYLKRINAGWQIGYFVLFFLLIPQWNILGYYALSCVPIALGALASFATRKLEIVIHKDWVAWPSVPPKLLYWKNISYVILKDDLLTIELNNNKLMQQYIDEKETIIDEKEFNEFCNSRMNAPAIV